MISEKKISETMSLCPICLQPVKAVYVQRGTDVYLEKQCQEHGFFSTIVWRGEPSLEDWRGTEVSIDMKNPPPCPSACGLCEYHRQSTCCIMIHVTERCNLNCSFCFADSKTAAADPSLKEIKSWIDDIAKKGITYLHVTGGEPTVRNDLPEIIHYAFKRGFEYIQLNTNGIRLGDEAGYAQLLAESGLSSVFLQFDGINDDIYLRLRGQRLLDVKQRAIESCGTCKLGVVLVPMLVPGINTDDIGSIIDFAVSKSPAVRGVHFQPVSYFGRYPQQPSDNDRITLPEVMQNIISQSHGRVGSNSLIPSGCDHPMCGFHSDFIVEGDRLIPLTRRSEKTECCCRPIPAEKNQQFVGRRWKRMSDSRQGKRQEETDSFDAFLEQTAVNGFTITGMAFQDCYNIDLERLSQCSLHVYKNGKVVPFCARYITADNKM